MLKSYAMTDVGQKREINQDFVFTSEQAVGNLPNLFAVADGMGGHKAGDFASRFTMETVVNTVKNSEHKNPVKILKEAVDIANEKLIEAAGESEDRNGMGTTFVAGTVIGHYLYTANVGDSRLYIVNEEGIHQVTKDHSLVEEMVRIGEINKEDARNHPDKNIITRAIGASRDILVDFFNTRLQEGDLILLCSDGLTNMVEDREINRIVRETKGLEGKVRDLIVQANKNGGKDNIAVIIIEPFSSEVKGC